jgi:putative transposase
MKGFHSVGVAQRFLSAFSGISPHFRPRRHLMTASGHRAEMTIRFALWDQITGAASRPTTPRRTVRQSRTRQRDNASWRPSPFPTSL